MNIFIKYSLFLLLICWGSIGLSQEIQFTEHEKKWMQEHPVIEFGYDYRWEPYEILVNGQYGGIVGDYVKIVEEKTGIKLKPVPNMTWEKSLKGLKEGTVMMVPSCVSTPERKKQILLSQPYIKDPIVIVARKDAPYFSTLNDLKEKSISLSKNYYTIELIKNEYPAIKIKEYKTIEACLTAVTNGESDAFIGNLNVITYYINHYGFDNLRIIGTTPFHDNGVCFAFNPEWTTFKGIVDKVLQQVSPKEQHEIRKKWIAPKETHLLSISFIFWSIIIFLIVLIGLVVFYFWNRILKKKLQRKKKTEQQLKTLLVEVKKSDEEKKVLLQEIHHRVKNNLQIVSSMLNLQANTSKDDSVREELKEAMDRVASIALIHKKMYQSPSVDAVNLRDYTETLYNDIAAQYPNTDEVKIEVNTIAINNTMSAITPLALILNELITNSLKYAFHSQENPKITIEFSIDKNNKSLKMKYIDNGTWIENKASDHFGTSMIEIFTEQLEGSYELIKEQDKTIYHFEFNGVNG